MWSKIKNIFVDDSKIVASDEKYTWSLFNKNETHFYIINKSGKKTTFLCEDHYHKIGGEIVDVVVDKYLVEYALSNIKRLGYIQDFYTIDESFLEEYFIIRLREKKLERILK